MEVPEPLMDCNFPEMLAGDLGLSEEVFRSKNLTAGAPAASLSGHGGRRHNSLQDRSSGLLSSPDQRHVLVRMRSLQTVESGNHQLDMASGRERRQSFESTSTDSSGGMEPPSVAGRGREVSVGTAATSVTSGRFSASDKSNSPIDKNSNGSWTDLQLTNDAHHSSSINHNSSNASQVERCQSLSNIRQQSSPRSPLDSPRSPRDIGGELRTISLGNGKPSPSVAEPLPAFKSPMNFGTSLMQPETPSSFNSSTSTSTRPNGFPARRSSLTQNSDFLRVSYQRASPHSPSSVRHSSIINSNLMPTVTPTRRPSSAGNASPYSRDDEARSMLSLNSDDEDDEDDDTFDQSVATPKEVNQVATPTIVSPLADIERWVDQSSIEFGHLPSPTKDFQGSRLHVAPEVLDTLRISVACFPETILTCSSLSIETIRGNGKKVRFRKLDIADDSQLSLDSPDASAKPSKWKWLTTKRAPEPSPTKLQPSQRYLPPPLDEAIEPQSQKAVWQSVKNIFPKGTDHLCDALYAHILAYNYVTSLCPPSTVVTQTARPGSKQSSAPSISDKASLRSDNNKIPHKAATLLGLENDPSTTAPPRDSSTTARPDTRRGKTGFMQGKRENTKTFGSVANRTSDEHDQSLKDLRYGLAKCIARLVGTLRLTSGEPLTQSKSVRPGDIKDIDPLFIRALCEVVRCNEEG
ncbi:hypothetical protein PFICI_14075 [Pestalotiopsis fici W106-1]|uniref:Uncharacterized protein n=1 Tax=Pestalotiopsis fici (strain W106-1 / CGMCC3.15140) TaxID=1229662 RepID=W3WKA3_PESFW|nr:uncharacterized protein PFICI_14075 [Pestalotiopsis fici W106-1]ETS74209.1 hypothetical protein PFICI_14075 [Pestalotiopsis fici W106-1]